MGAADDSSAEVGAREVELVRAAYTQWNEGDLEALSELMAEDVIYQNAPEWPGQRVYRGSDTVMRFLRDEVFETIALTPVEVVGTEVFGDEILIELNVHTHGTISGLDLAKSRLFHVSRVSGGKVVRTRVYLDEQQAIAAARTGSD